MAESKEGIFKISKDLEQAKDLLEMAKERKDIIIDSIPKSVPYKILEEYYEIVTQLITGIMYSDGFKTLSHVKLIEYMKNYSNFNQYELEILDKMRKFRHGTVYYGRKESGNFFINHKKEIKIITTKLFKILEKKFSPK